MKKPSNKQIIYAKDIAFKLGIELPKQNTAKAYWEFIREHDLDCKCRVYDDADNYYIDASECY